MQREERGEMVERKLSIKLIEKNDDRYIENRLTFFVVKL